MISILEKVPVRVALEVRNSYEMAFCCACVSADSKYLGRFEEIVIVDGNVALENTHVGHAYFTTHEYALVESLLFNMELEVEKRKIRQIYSKFPLVVEKFISYLESFRHIYRCTALLCGCFRSGFNPVCGEGSLNEIFGYEIGHWIKRVNQKEKYLPTMDQARVMNVYKTAIDAIKKSESEFYPDVEVLEIGQELEWPVGHVSKC